MEGEAREARLKLLRELAADGATLDELRRAVAEQRLALLPVERILSGGESASPRPRLRRGPEWTRSSSSASGGRWGWRCRPTTARIYTERDVEAARRVQALRDGGLPDEGVLEVARLLGMTMSQLAAANRRLIADAYMREGDTEYDAAHRFAAATEEFLPLIGASLSHVLALHLREQIRHDAFGQAELASGRAATTDEVTVCFADMVEFTKLGERLDFDELGRDHRKARRARLRRRRATGAAGEADR